MAPTRQTAGPSNENPNDASTKPSNTATTLQEDLVAANAEIEQLRVQLAAWDTPALATPNLDRLAAVLEVLSGRLDRVESHSTTPASSLGKSTKLLDLPIFTDGKDPTFKR
jgi:hypothetical protein